MKDSPNGKRYGRRDLEGRIVEAYGFDLSPIAARHAEFVQLAEEARAERAAMGRLRRRATIARNGIAQILETAAEYGFQGEEWPTLGARHPGDRAGAEGSSGRRKWRGGREPGAPAARGANAWKCFSKMLIRSPRGPKTDPTNIPTNQSSILNRIR